MSDKKYKFPSFIEYTYVKWYFWLIVTVYFLWSSYEDIANETGVSLIMVLIVVIVIVSLFFLFSYWLTKSTCKKLGYT